MTTTSAGNGKLGGDPRQFGLLRVYTKDISFESPNSPEVFDQLGSDPEIQFNLRTSHRKVGESLVEVVLKISSHATLGDKTVFLVEVQQAGLFQLAGYAAEEQRAIVSVACPNALFPYARETVSSVVQRGGFPPLYLQPMDFATLYAQQQQQAAAAPAAGNA